MIYLQYWQLKLYNNNRKWIVLIEFQPKYHRRTVGRIPKLEGQNYLIVIFYVFGSAEFEKNSKKNFKIMIELGAITTSILRRLSPTSSKSVQQNSPNHGYQVKKRGFEKNAFKVLRLYEGRRAITSLKWLYLSTYFEF